MCVPKQIVPTVPKRELSIVLLFLGKFSLNLRKRFDKLVRKYYHYAILRLFFSLKIDWAACLNSRTPFPYIVAPTLFTNFNVIIAILITIAKLNFIIKLELVSK